MSGACCLVLAVDPHVCQYAPAHTMADTEPRAQSAVILNVDDDEAGRYAVTRMLQRAGHSVVEAATGPEALELALRLLPDVVILDVNLPGLDGYEVARRLRADPATAPIPILHLSATSIDTSSIATGLGSGGDAYLCEPVEELILLAQVATLLRMRQLYSAVAEAQRQAESQAQQLAIALEELQAANEELGSANEELEVANEELRTAYEEVSERRAEVERQRAFLEAILQQVPIGINIGYDPSGEMMTTNDVGREIFEVALGENVSASAQEGQRPANRYLREGRKLAGDDLPMQQAVAQDRVLRDVELEMQSASGKQRWLRVNAAPVHDAEGRTIGSVGVTWDVTEEKRAEEALRKSEREQRELAAALAAERSKLQAILDALPVAVTIAEDPEVHVISANPAAAAMFEVPPGGNLSAYAPQEHRLWGRYFHQGRELSPEEMPMQLAVMQDRVVETMEIEAILPSGRRWVGICSAVPLHDPEGRVIGGVAVATDITERQRLEKALRESEVLLQTVLDNSPEPIFLKDRDSRLLLANPAMLAVIGKPAEAALGRTDAELYDDPRTGRAIMENDRRAMESGQVEMVEETIFDPAGPRVYLSIKAPYRDAEGRVVGLIGTAHEITAQKRAEAALRQSEERFRSVLGNSLDCVYRYNVQAERFEYVSPAAEAIVGYAPDELVALTGEAALAMIHPDDVPAMQAALARLAETGEAEAEYRQQAKGGGYRWISNHMSLTRDGAGRPLYRDGTIRDITTRKQAEEERERLHAQLLAVERSRAELAENLNREIAHRTKNNLAMVAGLLQLQMLQQRSPETTSALSDAVSRVMTFASIQQELQSDASGWLDLLPILQRVAAASGEALAAQGVTISVSGDAVFLPQKAAINAAVAANELVTNAAKHGAPGPEGRLRVEVTVESTQTSLRLRVWNSGNPISEDFEVRERRGLGLLLVRDLAANQYGGTFTLTPEAGGTLAEIIVPLEALRTA